MAVAVEGGESGRRRRRRLLHLDVLDDGHLGRLEQVVARLDGRRGGARAATVCVVFIAIGVGVGCCCRLG